MDFARFCVWVSCYVSLQRRLHTDVGVPAWERTHIPPLHSVKNKLKMCDSWSPWWGFWGRKWAWKKNLINEADFPLSDGWLMVRSLPPPAARLFPWRSQPESLLLALCKYVQINEHTCADMPTHITHRSHYLPPVWKSTLLTSLTMCSFPNLYSLFHTFQLKYNKVEEIRCRKSSWTKRKPNIYIYINGLNTKLKRDQKGFMFSHYSI